MKKSLIATLMVLISVSLLGQGLSVNTITLFSVEEQKKDTVIINNWLQPIKLSMYGGGAILGQVTSTGEEALKEGTSTSGSIGLNFLTERVSLDVFYSYNARKVLTMDSLYKFGRALMNPDLSGQSFSASLIIKICPFAGAFGSVQVADQLWEMDSTNSPAIIPAAPFLLRAGLTIRPFRIPNIPNKLGFSVDVCYTHRSVLGDYNNNDHTIEGNTIPRRGFNGFDVTTNLFINYVNLFFRYSLNPQCKGEVYPSLTGSQITIGLSVAADMIILHDDGTTDGKAE